MIDYEERFLRYLDGELDQREFADLSAWMIASPDHATELAKLALLNVHLRDRFRFGEFLDASPQRTNTAVAAPRAVGRHWRLHGGGRRTTISFTVAAVVIGLLITAMGLIATPIYRHLARPAVAPGESRPGQFVAQLTGTHEATWEIGQVGSTDGAHLMVGQQMKLQQGLAEITFKSGARVLLNGPVSFTIESNNSGRLAVGRLAANVPKAARGFTIDTPSARIIDIGTEFVVEVEPSGSTELGVDVGVVQLQSQGPEIVKRVVAGQIAQVDGSGVKVSAGTISKRFAHYLPGSPYGDLVVQDAVEDDGTWNLSQSGGEFDGSGYGQISRAAVEGEVVLAMINLENDGGSKRFGNVPLAPGVYNVTFWMGNYTSAQFPPAMTAEVATSRHSLVDLLVHSSKPIPASGGWSRWTLTYEVPPDDARIGEPLRFEVRDGGGAGNAAFDSLRIWHKSSRIQDN